MYVIKLFFSKYLRRILETYKKTSERRVKGWLEINEKL
jgi:hypothetical protein